MASSGLNRGKLRSGTRHNRVQNTKGSAGTWTAKRRTEAKRQQLADASALSRRDLVRRLRSGAITLRLAAALEGNEAEAAAMRSFAEEVFEAARRLGIRPVKTPDPIAAAVDAQLGPLGDELKAFGHKRVEQDGDA